MAMTIRYSLVDALTYVVYREILENLGSNQYDIHRADPVRGWQEVKI